jgi:hypothetical protein
MNEAIATTERTSTPRAGPRTRRSRKRLVFQPPRNVPRSVRSLWDEASAEERTRAHETCVSILSMWLGQKSRTEVATELALPPLRVWQLSQAAVSGMLAGLLKQPRVRQRGRPMEASEDERALRERLAELEEENRSLRSLVEVLRNLPPAREPRLERASSKPKSEAKAKPAPKARAKTEKKSHGAVQRGAEGGGGPPPGPEGSPPR